MRKRNRILVVFGVLALLASVAPAVSRSAKLARCADGLLALATMDVYDVSRNPWHWDSYLVPPDVAVWLLLNTESPYSCLSVPADLTRGFPLIHYAVSSPEAEEVRPRILRIIEHLAARGADLDEKYDGRTPLHNAVLYDDIELVQTLVRLGADPEERIQAPDREYDGMNAVEYARYLNSGIDDDDWKAVHEFLRVHQS